METREKKRLAGERYDRIIAALNPSEWQSAETLLFDSQKFLNEYLDDERKQNTTRLSAFFKEIDEGERQPNASKSSPGKPQGKGKKEGKPNAVRDHRKIRKEISNVERKIAQLDERRRELDQQLLTATDPEEAMRLHNEVTALAEELAAAEERWCELSGPSM